MWARSREGRSSCCRFWWIWRCHFKVLFSSDCCCGSCSCCCSCCLCCRWGQVKLPVMHYKANFSIACHAAHSPLPATCPQTWPRLSSVALLNLSLLCSSFARLWTRPRLHRPAVPRLCVVGLGSCRIIGCFMQPFAKSSNCLTVLPVWVCAFWRYLSICSFFA